MVWLLGRTQTNNSSDYENVRAIQKGFVLMALSQYPDGPPQARPRPVMPAGPPVRPPVQVERLSGVEFFRVFADLLEKNPPHRGDEPMVAKLARIGITAGKPFQPESLGAEGVAAIEAGAQTAAARLAALDGRNPVAGKTGWSGGGANVGRYGTNYAARAFVARVGLGALPPEDAFYMHCHEDSKGSSLDGASNYTIHFAKGQAPPVKAFWSVTMYSEDGYFVANPIRRYAIGDRDPLKFNADGSLDLYIQHAAPGGEKDANWLPSPEGKFNLSLRMYWPSDDIVSGKWIPPAVERRP